jgi:GNAT superfamily N-acetyltransferase
MNNNVFYVVKAEKKLFAVYQTIYSNVDTNIHFSWKERLNDTLWTDECYWVMKKDQKIGGVIIQEDTTRFAFLIAPFNDRELFWKIVHNYINQSNKGVTKMYSVHDCDLDILLSYGYKVEFSRKMMYRPTDYLVNELNRKFYYNIPDLKNNLDEMINVIYEGYKNGIDFASFGEESLDEIKKDILRFVKNFIKTNTLDQSTVIYLKKTDKIVAICFAGQNPKSPKWKSFIYDIVVLPEYRNNGIGEFMICKALAEANKTSQIMGLCVTVGNTAEILYRKLGFLSGPRFTSMSLRNN